MSCIYKNCICQTIFANFLFHARITCVLSSIEFFLHHTSVSPFNWLTIMIKSFEEPRLAKRRSAGKDLCIVCNSLAWPSLLTESLVQLINVKVHQPLINFLQLPPDFQQPIIYFLYLGKWIFKL